MSEFHHIPAHPLSELEMRKMILELQTENAALAHALQIEREWVVSLTRDNGVLLQAADATKAGSLAVSQAGQIEHLEREKAALREALLDAEELERYSGSNGERQWGRCSAWLHPDDAVIIISAKALDAVRKGEQP